MNKQQRVKAAVVTSVFSAGVIFGGLSHADATLNKVLAVGQSKTTSAQQSQKRVDKLAEATGKLLQKYKLVIKDTEGLKVYNAQLEKQVENRERQIRELDEAIGNITVLQRQIPPLAVRMLDALEQFVELDVPSQIDTRRGEIGKVRRNLSKADFSVAEKFRQVLELYSIEGEAGRKIETYSTTIDIGGQPREVDVLAIGRIALMYQTKDTKLSGAWDQRQRAWIELDSGVYRNAIRQGIKIANKQASIDVMQLPIIAPESAQ